MATTWKDVPVVAEGIRGGRLYTATHRGIVVSVNEPARAEVLEYSGLGAATLRMYNRREELVAMVTANVKDNHYQKGNI